MSERPLASSLDGPDGAPVLVLGNSLGTARSVWDPQVPTLAKQFRLLRFEWPGHGGSPAAAGPYSIGALAAGVLDVLDSHGIDRAAYCGISLGAMTGMWLAAHHRDRVAALALVCTSAYLPPAEAWRDRAAQVRAAGMTSVSAQVVARWFTPSFAAREPGVPAALRAELERCDPEGYAGCCEAIADMDLRPDLVSIAAPTLVISAAEDPATPPPHGATIAARIPGARLAVVRGAAHLANVSNPGEVTAALLAHLALACLEMSETEMRTTGRSANAPAERPEGEPGDDGSGPARDSDFVQSLDRGLAVIRAFGPDRERLSLSEVARATGLTRAAARRFLLTLVKLGYVRSDGREFSLRPRVLELGYAYLSGLALPEIAAPHLEELVAKLRESSSVSVLDGHHIVYVARVPTKRIMTVAISVGTRFPAYATSMGRVLLAGMTEPDFERYLAEADFEALTGRTVTDPAELRRIVQGVAAQGYAIVDQELEEGLRAIAAPIRGPDGTVTAAINVSAHASRISDAAMRSDLLPALLSTAAAIETDLRAVGTV